MKMIIITGLPGTGKTTFARRLAKEIEARHLNTDMIRDAMGKRGQYDADTKASIYNALFSETKKELSSGRIVVVDGTFYQQSLREDFKQLAEQYQANIYWIEIKADEEIIRERVSKQRTYSEANFDVYLKIKAQYEELTTPRLVLQSDHSELDKMVEQAKNYVNEIHDR